MSEIISHNGQVQGIVINSDSTQSTSTSSGSVLLSGGIGCAKDISCANLNLYGPTSTNYLKISPNTSTDAYTLTLPSSQGVYGQHLISTGSGTIDWSTYDSVTQLTSLQTDVSLTSFHGKIICFGTNSIAADSRTNFTFNNGFITTNSVILVSLSTAAANVNAIVLKLRFQQTGFVIIDLHNVGTGTVTNYNYVINFHIIN